MFEAVFGHAGQSMRMMGLDRDQRQVVPVGEIGAGPGTETVTVHIANHQFGHLIEKPGETFEHVSQHGSFIPAGQRTESL